MENAIHMFRSSSNRQMNGFVITTEEGGVILIDGGYREDAPDVLDYLRKVTGQEKPHLDAVWLSHAHEDHIPCFIKMVKEHENEFSFDALYFNFPSVQFLEGDADYLPEFYSLMPKFADRMTLVFGGDRYGIRGATFDVLYSPDYAFTRQATGNVCNNSSVVFRVTVGGKTVLFLGDCGVEAGNRLIREYGEALKSDYCQMAHHGQNGVTEEFYALVKPSGCFWCTPDWLWNNDVGQGFDTYIFNTVKTRRWMDRISPDRVDYVMMNGTQVVKF